MIGPNCMGVINTEADVAPERHLRADAAARRLDRLRLAVGRVGRRDPQRRRRSRYRIDPVRLDGQQGRRLRQRSARALGGRSGDAGDRDVPRVVRQPAALHRDRQARRAQEADPGRQVGAHRRGRARGLVAHRRARRRRRHHLRLSRAVRRPARRHDPGALRRRPRARPLSAARGQPRSPSSPTPAAPASWRPTPASTSASR